MNEMLSPQSRCQKTSIQFQAEHTLKTGGALNIWKVLRSLIHTCLWQGKMLATVSYNHRERLPPCLHCQQEGMYSHFFHLSAKSDGLLYTSDGLEQGCQTRCWTPRGSQTHSVSLTFLPGRMDTWERYLQLLQLICQHLGRHAHLFYLEVGKG